jgi:hypothetical protein
MDDDAFAKHQRALLHNAPKAPPRQPQPGELLFEFHVERTHTFYRVELRDRGAYGVEAQFLDPIDVCTARLFPSRELAIAWQSKSEKPLRPGNDSPAYRFYSWGRCEPTLRIPDCVRPPGAVLWIDFYQHGSQGCIEGLRL